MESAGGEAGRILPGEESGEVLSHPLSESILKLSFFFFLGLVPVVYFLRLMRFLTRPLCEDVDVVASG